MMTFIIIAAIVFCLIALIAEDFGVPRRRRTYKHGSQTMNKYRGGLTSYNDNHFDVYCPECGSPNVTIYRDGSCKCQDCEFPFHIDYL